MLHHTFIFDQSCTLKFVKENKRETFWDWKMGRRVEGREEVWKSLYVDERTLRCSQEKI